MGLRCLAAVLPVRRQNQTPAGKSVSLPDNAARPGHVSNLPFWSSPNRGVSTRRQRPRPPSLRLS
eukprot:4915206-Lingulodinium_polyedra.AAC.1